MPTLFTYCISHDNGAAPNPFGGVCTLAICKPVIRRTARLKDWVVGTGSVLHGFENKVVYAMEVTKILTMEKYDEHCHLQLPLKIPDWDGAKSYRERVGDCIYDFSSLPAILRKSVHNEGNRERDLDGSKVLLSNHFYYFGDTPKQLPANLLPIVRQGQGHKSKSNDQYFEQFYEWIVSQTQAKNKVFAEPFGRTSFIRDGDYVSKCAAIDKHEDDMDEASACE